VKSLLKVNRPPEHVIQWPQGWEIEDVVGWILGGEEDLVPLIQAEMPTAPASIAGIVTWIKIKPSDKGAKTDILAYEAIMSALLTSSSAKLRTRALLEALVDLTTEKPSSQFLLTNQTLTTAATSVWRIVLEP
jgi:putative ATP-dependent endonuclease of OLD family